jgi:hypothetical protein
VYDGSRLKKDFRLADNEVWHETEVVLALAMPSPFRRVIERLSGEM